MQFHIPSNSSAPVTYSFCVKNIIMLHELITRLRGAGRRIPANLCQVISTRSFDQAVALGRGYPERNGSSLDVPGGVLAALAKKLFGRGSGANSGSSRTAGSSPSGAVEASFPSGRAERDSAASSKTTASGWSATIRIASLDSSRTLKGQSYAQRRSMSGESKRGGAAPGPRKCSTTLANRNGISRPSLSARGADGHALEPRVEVAAKSLFIDQADAL